MVDDADGPAPSMLDVLGQASSARGEVVLRRRTADGVVVHELIINGVFAMDSRETSTEELLAEYAVARPGAQVLVGGLGLGYTAAALLATRLSRLVVVEIEDCLVEWARDGRTPTLAAVTADPRVELWIADIHQVLSEPAPGAGWDAIVLDVDNGPDFLIHQENARLYAVPALDLAVARLAPGGMLVVWCQETHEPLRDRLVEAVGPLGEVVEHLHQVRREGRRLDYVLYAATRSGPHR